MTCCQNDNGARIEVTHTFVDLPLFFNFITDLIWNPADCHFGLAKETTDFVIPSFIKKQSTLSFQI
jgi:hypothetical protein